MSITVLNPGLLTTVQDQGRWGYQQFGVPVSGACDPHSAAMANIFVSNDPGEGVLECTLMGPQLRFDCDEVIAITGGDLSPSLDAKPIPTYTAVEVKAGQTLRFGAPKTGCRAYLAVAGGFDIPKVMGSQSTYMKAALGGLDGRKLQKGDVLKLKAPVATFANIRQRHISPEFLPRPVYTLRVILGPQDDAFTEKGVADFLGSEYTVTQEFDRMGCRMEGPVIEHKNGGDIISDGIAFGAIQVPGAGKPILMLADHQTTGGYTKIANVITADFRLAGQLKGGDKVRFEKVTVAQAQELLRCQRESMKLLTHVVNAH